LIPRNAFDNKTKNFLQINSAFDDVIGYLQELSGGPSDGATLVYTSTSDPVTGYAVALKSLSTILKYYGMILDLAKKTIDFRKTVKDMREIVPDASLADGKSFDDVLKQTIRRGLEETTAQIVKTSSGDVTEGRKAEISNAITMKSSTVISAVANGARISVSLESQITLDKDLSGSAVTFEEVKEILGRNHGLEVAATDSFRLLNEHVPLLEGGGHD
jgi:hypothetical protein